MFKLFSGRRNNREKETTNKENAENIPLDNNFERVIKKVEEIYSYPQNSDFVMRKFKVPFLKRDAVIFYFASMIDGDKIERTVLNPLTQNNNLLNYDLPIEEFIETYITVQNIKKVSTMNEVIDEINSGKTILFIDEVQQAFAVDTIGFAHRNVERAQNETVIKGPLESFVESAGINQSLIRKQLKSKNLISESIIVGKRDKNAVTMMYVNDIANDSLVESVRERLSQIDVDIVQNLETLEQFIEERSFSLVPSVLYTERPDRAVSYLTEGHVVLLMDNSATCVIVPVTYWALLHSAEDSYLRLMYGNFVRFVRFIATFIALLTPATYLAITEFHSEMLPTDMLLAIAATREQVPFPALLELIFMEMVFEILREAGIRIPNPIGPTIGIVGALILGQAAVDANIVSPIMVIVVALTGLASFAIPDVSLSYMIRIMRFIFSIAAGSFGVFGIVIVMGFVFAYMSSVKSFNVPFFAPVAPYYKSSYDAFFRIPVWSEFLRPGFLKTKDKVRASQTRRGNKP